MLLWSITISLIRAEFGACFPLHYKDSLLTLIITHSLLDDLLMSPSARLAVALETQRWKRHRLCLKDHIVTEKMDRRADLFKVIFYLQRGAGLGQGLLIHSFNKYLSIT